MQKIPEMSERYSMRSVDRVAGILNYLGEHSSATMAEIAAATGLPRPTVLRLLEALARHGFTARNNDGGFQLGPRFIFLAMKGSGMLDLKLAAQPVIYRLARETGETVALSVLTEEGRVYIEQVESTQPVRRVIELNKPLPLHCGASARALLAWLPEKRIRELLEGATLIRFTERTVTDPDELMTQLREVRRTGYATSYGERVEDGTALAAPILTRNNHLLAAVAVLAPLHRTPAERLLGWAPLVTAAAREIAVRYGAFPPAVERSNDEE